MYIPRPLYVDAGEVEGGEVKKQYKNIIVFALIAIVFQLLVEYQFKKDTPEELESYLSAAQEDSELIKEIGGYRSYEFTYNYDKRDAEKEYDFEVTVFGQDGYVSFEGSAQYDPNLENWFIAKCDTLIKRY